MGTFHDDRGDLHGITVAAFAADTAYVGRCHEMDDQRLMLMDGKKIGSWGTGAAGAKGQQRALRGSWQGARDPGAARGCG